MPEQHGLHPAATAATSDEARAGRSELEWAMARNPERARLAAAALLSEGAGAARRWHRGFAGGYEAFSRRDWEINTLLVHPDDYVFRAADFKEAGPDFGEEHVGVAAYLAAIANLLESWPDARIDLVDILLAEGGRVVTLMHWAGSGARSGLELDWRCVGDHRWRDGLVVEQTYWWDVERGLRKLGLPSLEPGRR